MHMTTVEVDRILEAMEREFMKPVVTRKLEWFEIDGTHGTTFLAVEDAPGVAVRAQEDESIIDDELDSILAESLADYYEGTIQSVTTRVGYGARLSAPGYMDATEWTVFSTEQEAREYLAETYGDDVDLDSEA